MTAEEYLALDPAARSEAWATLSPEQRLRARNIESDQKVGSVYPDPAKVAQPRADGQPVSATLSYFVACCSALGTLFFGFAAFGRSSIELAYVAGGSFTTMVVFWALGDIVKNVCRSR